MSLKINPNSLKLNSPKYLDFKRKNKTLTETASWFVAKQNGRIGDDLGSERQTTSFATRDSLLVAFRITDSLFGAFLQIQLHHHLFDSLQPLTLCRAPLHSQHGLEHQMLFHLERADEQVVLLHVAAHRRDLLDRVDQLAVDFYVALDFERAAIAKIEHVQESRLAAAARAHDRQHLVWFRNTRHLKTKKKI